MRIQSFQHIVAHSAQADSILRHGISPRRWALYLAMTAVLTLLLVA
jgi:hypothetical protein